MATSSEPKHDSLESWRLKAEIRCKERGARLTPARLAAFSELVKSDQPLSAYELVALLEQRENRKIAPLTVYRHLDFLMGVGLVHRLESTQSYLPCAFSDHTHDSQYLMCSQCGRVDELASSALSKALADIATAHEFAVSNAVIEITGLCARCDAGDSAHATS